MKLVRPLLIGCTVVVVLLVVAVSIAFTSGFQTWAVRRAIASQPDIKGTIGSVSAGLKQVDVKDARFEQKGAVLTLPALHAELPLVSAGLKKKIFVSKLVAKGWVLDLSNVPPPAAAAPAKKTAAIPAATPREFSLLSGAYAADAPASVALRPVFQGIFSQLQLPVDLALDEVELEGELILPAAPKHASTRLSVAIRGGGLQSGREGKFSFDLATRDTAGAAPVSTVALHGTLTATMDTPHSFTRLATNAEASATGTQFPRGVKLNADVAAARETKGESYALTIVGEGRQLAVVQADFPQTAGSAVAAKLTGTWKLDVRDADITPFTLGMELPAFVATGEGSFESDAALVEIHAVGKLNATADKLAVVRSELAVLGAVKVAATFDGALHGDAIRVDKLTADLSDTKPVATVNALQGFEFNPKTSGLKVADPTRDLLGITLQAVPLAWLKPFLKDISVSGGDLSGEIVASAREDGATLRSKAPLVVTNLSVEQAGKPLLRDVDVSAALSGDYTPEGWQAAVAPLTAKNGAATLVSLEAKAGQRVGKDQPLKATGIVTLNLPGVLAQPVLAQAFAGLTRGEASVEFAGSFAAKQELQAKIVLKNLAADPKLTAEELPAATAEIRADREPGGKITFTAPVLVERGGRKSDVNLAGTVTPQNVGLAFDAAITSTLLVVDDVKIFSAPFAASSSAPVEEKKTPGTTDNAPPWANLKGKASLAMKKIVYSDSFEASDVTGTLTLEPGGALKLEGFRADVKPEGQVNVSGVVSYDPKRPEPYTLEANFVAKEFDPGPLFRAINPQSAPTIEGKMSMTTAVSGTAKSLGLLAERTRGKFELNSKGGIFRGLAATVPEDKLRAAQSYGAMLGSLVGGSTTKVITQISEVLKDLSAISYDQFNVTAERDADLNLVLRDFSLISPEVRLGGEGKIIYAPGKSLLQQTLDMQFTLGARGKIGDKLNELKLLKPEKDQLGYTAFSAPIKIGGTLDKPDKGDWVVKLTEYAIQKSGIQDKAIEAWNKLFGK